MANNLEAYYETLGLQPGASPKAVRQAYLDLTKVWHPDRFMDDPRLKKRAEAQLREINGAYEHLRAALEARAPRQPAEGEEAAAGGWLARLPMSEIMAALILVAMLAVLAVVVMACHQLTSSPAAALPVAAAGLA